MLGRAQCGIMPIRGHSGVQGGGECGLPTATSQFQPATTGSSMTWARLDPNTRAAITAASATAIPAMAERTGTAVRSRPDDAIGALLAATMAAWLHQLTTATRGETILAGHGTRGGKAMGEIAAA